MNISQVGSLLYIGMLQRISAQTLDRTPEPSMLMESPDQVNDYHHAAQTNLDLIYCLSAELINAWNFGKGTRALDLGCGTADASIRIASALKLSDIVAIDGSDEMLANAKRNVLKSNADSKFTFVKGNILDLGSHPDDNYDISYCILTSHHLDDISSVSSLLTEMRRVTRPDGIVLLLDLARLKSRHLVNRYVATFSEGQSACHNTDFSNSMHASFTPAEMMQAIPNGDQKGRWFHGLSPVVPTLQAVVGVSSEITRPAARLWTSNPVSWISESDWERISTGFLKNAKQAFNRK